MDGTSSGPRRIIGAAAAAIVALAALGAGLAFAGSTGNTYTGCLKPSGALVKVTIGSSPLSACNATQTQISWNEVGQPGADGQPGAGGASAYEIWLAAGNVGTEADFLASLVGEQGPPGASIVERVHLPEPVEVPANSGPSPTSVNFEVGEWSLPLGETQFVFASLTGTTAAICHAADGQPTHAGTQLAIEIRSLDGDTILRPFISGVGSFAGEPGNTQTALFQLRTDQPTNTLANPIGFFEPEAEGVTTPIVHEARATATGTAGVRVICLAPSTTFRSTSWV